MRSMSGMFMLCMSCSAIASVCGSVAVALSSRRALMDQRRAQSTWNTDSRT